jgi:hypothetical protein
MNKIEKFFSEYKNTITIISGILIVIGFFIAADNYIGNEIEKKITDETYINKLAHVLRPFSIFDKKGVIQYDHGGERYIENIDIQKKDDGDFQSIIITTKEFLQNPPILIYIGYDNYAYTSERVDTYKWKFNLSSLDVLILSGENSDKFDPIFIVEITK